MQPFETWLKADLQAPVTVKRIDGNLFSGDNQGNLVGVTVTDAGEPATLSGEVRGYFIRSDGNTVIMSGTIDGNMVTVVLPSACYTVVGQFSLVIKVGQVAVGACTGYVYQSSTDAIVDPGHVIPSLDELLAQISTMQTATEQAQTATSNANTAASAANSAASAANTAAENANTKAGLANTAAQTANSAATKIDDMTVTASGLPAGSAPTAAVTEVSGHKQIAFGIPKGDKGEESVMMATQIAGNQYRLSVGRE